MRRETGAWGLLLAGVLVIGLLGCSGSAETPDDDGGCDCTTVGGGRTSWDTPILALLALAGIALVLRR